MEAMIMPIPGIADDPQSFDRNEKRRSRPMSPDSQSASRQLTKKTQQQRSHPRYAYDSPAMICRPLGPARAGWIQNLSEGGVMVELSEPFPPGTPLDVFISLTGKSIRAEAKVIWSQNSLRR
jgi:hypothetical protein